MARSTGFSPAKVVVTLPGQHEDALAAGIAEVGAVWFSGGLMASLGGVLMSYTLSIM